MRPDFRGGGGVLADRALAGSRPSALWLFLTTYALLYGAFGMQSPFVPALLRERGLQAQDIGLVLATAMVVRVFVGPVIAHAADRLRRHTLILCGCALFAALASISYLRTHSLAGLLWVALLHAAMLLGPRDRFRPSMRIAQICAFPAG